VDDADFGSYSQSGRLDEFRSVGETESTRALLDDEPFLSGRTPRLVEESLPADPLPKSSGVDLLPRGTLSSGSAMGFLVPDASWPEIPGMLSIGLDRLDGVGPIGDLLLAVDGLIVVTFGSMLFGMDAVGRVGALMGLREVGERVAVLPRVAADLDVTGACLVGTGRDDLTAGAGCLTVGVR
jgi:hypothetical protein